MTRLIDSLFLCPNMAQCWVVICCPHSCFRKCDDALHMSLLGDQSRSFQASLYLKIHIKSIWWTGGMWMTHAGFPLLFNEQKSSFEKSGQRAISCHISSEPNRTAERRSRKRMGLRALSSPTALQRSPAPLWVRHWPISGGVKANQMRLLLWRYIYTFARFGRARLGSRRSPWNAQSC